MGDRCTGHCCHAITIGIAPHELQASYAAWLRNDQHQVSMSGEMATIFQDIHLIAPMLVHLGKFDRPPRGARPVNPTDEMLLNDGKFREPKHFYACKHFDAKAKACTIYEIRPAMCRAYPYGKGCNNAGCTWDGVRDKKQTRSERAKRLRVLQEGEAKAKDKGGDWKDKDIAKTKPKPKLRSKRKRGLGRGMDALIPRKKKKTKAKRARR